MVVLRKVIAAAFERDQLPLQNTTDIKDRLCLCRSSVNDGDGFIFRLYYGMFIAQQIPEQRSSMMRVAWLSTIISKW